MSPFLVPLAVFAMVVLIVALVRVAQLHSLEIEVHQRLHAQEMEHQRKMRELNQELDRIRQRT